MVHDRQVARARARSAKWRISASSRFWRGAGAVERQPANCARASAGSTKARANGVAVSTQTTSASGPAAKEITPTSRKALEKTLADQLARNELDEQIIEIELEQEENLSAMFEFVSDLSDPRRRLPGIAQRHALRAQAVAARLSEGCASPADAGGGRTSLLTSDAVVEQATQRAEQTGIVFLDEIRQDRG
jgi:ATP-dependent protease HslVU (ClpYQ) ATPase subunit